MKQNKNRIEIHIYDWDIETMKKGEDAIWSTRIDGKFYRIIGIYKGSDKK